MPVFATFRSKLKPADSLVPFWEKDYSSDPHMSQPLRNTLGLLQ